jgi:hypothetical protein
MANLFGLTRRNPLIVEQPQPAWLRHQVAGHTRRVLDTGQERTQDLVTTAQQLVTTVWQYPVKLRIQDVIRSWGRHTLLRCRVKDGPDDAADFLIVKAVNQDGQLVTDERAGLELLAELPDVRDLVPQLYAADTEDTMLVLADLGNGPSLGQLLQARAGWAQDGLLESMRGLAAVHASTRGRQERYAQLQAHGGTVTRVGRPTGRPFSYPELTEALARALGLIGIDDGDLPTTELQEAATRMSPPADMECLTFHDQCPSNRIMVDNRLRFIDLEQVAFSHPFLDAAYPLLGYLTCMDGLRLPDDLRQRMLAAYRTGLDHGYPELVEDGEFGLEITSACALKLLWHLSHLAEALDRDRVVGHFLVRRRQRLLAVLDAFIDAASTFDQLPRTREVSQQLLTRLTALWQESVEPLPLYPIFRQ